MPLTEAQIVRYSRQILLRDVGGVGQQKLLEAKTHAVGSGAALQTAAAYLAAGGSHVTLSLWEWAGVRAGAKPEAKPGERTGPAAPATQSFPLQARAAEAEPERDRDPPPRSSADALRGPGALVVQLCGPGTVVFADCASCVDQRAMNAHGESPPHLADLTGALAALAHQRLILGLGDRRGVITVSDEGAISVEPLPPCEECAR